jgi:hypothetical protein
MKPGWQHNASTGNSVQAYGDDARVVRYNGRAPFHYVGEYWGRPGDLEKELGREPTLAEILDRPLRGPLRKTYAQAIADIDGMRAAARVLRKLANGKGSDT